MTTQDLPAPKFNLVITAVLLGVFAYILCCGCASGYLYEERAGQQEALATIKEAFGAPASFEPPNIFWRGSQYLNCKYVPDPGAPGGQRWVYADVEHGADGWIDKTNECTNGVMMPGSFLEGPAWIELADVPGYLFWQLAMAHEVCHAYSRLLSGGHGDVNHRGPCWTGATPLESRAVNLLRERNQ